MMTPNPCKDSPIQAEHLTLEVFAQFGDTGVVRTIPYATSKKASEE